MADPRVDRLSAATDRLIGRPVTPEDRFGLAVSGGADSMAMLALAAQAWPDQIEAATVDHGLRPEAGTEAAMVARYCAQRGIPHATLALSQPIDGNLQAGARAARYEQLETWRVARGLNWLLTAHQADDQFETMILRLNRGAGVAGLACVRARRDHVLRPLLGEYRATLRDYCQAQDIPFIDDPSNIDARFDRARLRTALAGTDMFDPAGLNRSVDALTQADAALDWMASTLAAAHIHAADEGLVLDRTDLPHELLRRLLLAMIARVHPKVTPPRGPSVDQALVQLFDDKSVSLADCVVTGGTRWTVRRAPPRRTA